GEQIRISRRRRVLIRRRERAAQGGEAEVIARQQPGIALTDVAYAEGIDETIERNFPPAVDRIKEILRRLLAEPFTVLDPCQVARRSIARLQREDIGRRADQPILIKGIDQLGAEPLDIKGIARDEMLQPLHCLRAADKAAGAAPHRILLARRLVYLLRCMAAADRAVIGKDVRLAV